MAVGTEPWGPLRHGLFAGWRGTMRYYRRKLADGKSPREAILCLKRRLSDTVYKRLVTDAKIPTASPGQRQAPAS